MNQPQGRIDLLVLNLSQAVCQRIRENTGFNAWANGGEEFTKEVIQQLGLPTEPINIGKTLAQNLFSQPRQVRRARVRRLA
jgi:hypothetical protein